MNKRIVHIIIILLFLFFGEIFNSTINKYNNEKVAKNIYFVLTFIDFKILLLYTDMRVYTVAYA